MRLLILLSLDLSRFMNTNDRGHSDSFGVTAVVLFNTFLSTPQLFNYFTTFGYVIEKSGCKDPERTV